MLHTIDKLFNDVELIKKNICEGKKRCTSTPISNDMKSSNEPSCVSEFNVESFLKAFEEIEEEEPAEGSGSCIENLHSSMAEKRRNLSNSLFQDTMSRKKRKYSIHLADGVGETVVEVNSESWKNHNNPYLSSTSSEASSFASPSLPSFDLGPNRSALHGQRRLPRRENISTRLLIDQGFIKQDRDNHNKDLYLPFSVILAPLTHYPKLKKHQVIRLMEPDLDITSKSSYRGNPNPYCPSSSLDSTTISPIPSILLPSIVSHEKSIDSRSRT